MFNHRQLDYLFNSSFRLTIAQTPKSCITGLCVVKPLVTTENVSISWRYHVPLTRYVKLRVGHAPGKSGTFFPLYRHQRKPLVIDPGMYHGTCVTHVPWCMSGSLTRGENVPSIPGACRNPQFNVSSERPMWWTLTLPGANTVWNRYDAEITRSYDVNRESIMGARRHLHYLWNTNMAAWLHFGNWYLRELNCLTSWDRSKLSHWQ